MITTYIVAAVAFYMVLASVAAAIAAIVALLAILASRASRRAVQVGDRSSWAILGKRGGSISVATPLQTSNHEPAERRLNYGTKTTI